MMKLLKYQTVLASFIVAGACYGAFSFGLIAGEKCPPKIAVPEVRTEQKMREHEIGDSRFAYTAGGIKLQKLYGWYLSPWSPNPGDVDRIEMWTDLEVFDSISEAEERSREMALRTIKDENDRELQERIKEIETRMWGKCLSTAHSRRSRSGTARTSTRTADRFVATSVASADLMIRG